MAQPLCPYFGKCGGCSLQHLDYSVQLENKKKVLINSIKFNDVKVFSDNPYYYRNRMDMIFHKRGIGLRKRDKWYKLIDIENCCIADRGINKLIAEIRDFFTEVDYFDIKKHTGTFHFVIIRTASPASLAISKTSLSFVLNQDSTRLSDAIELIKKFAEKTAADNVIITYTESQSEVSATRKYFVVKGDDVLEEIYLGKKFFYSSQCFFQNNHYMAEKMHKYCHELLKNYDTQNTHLLDLYGGVGTFAIINAELFKSVTTIESERLSVELAMRNIEINNAKNVKAIELDAKQLRKINLLEPLFVITDPPRTGMHPNTIEQLNKLKPCVIIYISCNPAQLAKDIPKFKEYNIKSAALFDLFPQTNHSEAVVELVRR